MPKRLGFRHVLFFAATVALIVVTLTAADWVVFSMMAVWAGIMIINAAD